MSEADSYRADGLDERLSRHGAGDGRSQALIRTIAKARDEGLTYRYTLTDYTNVDVALLPYLVRGHALQGFMFDGITEDIVRSFLTNKVQLIEKIGTVDGVRFALDLIGWQVDWQQWWQQTPTGVPNTHVVTVFVASQIFDDPELLSAKAQTAAERLINATKRWSQDVTLQLGVGASGSIGIAGAFQSLAADRIDATVDYKGDDHGAVGVAGALQSIAADRVIADVDYQKDEINAVGVAGAVAALAVDCAVCEVI